MAKWSGKIGFAVQVNDHGICSEDIIERVYKGDLNRNTRRLESSGGVNDNISITNEFSIVADPYAKENFHTIRYIEFMGTKWKVINAEVQYPRLVLSAGGVYNGE